MYPPFLFADSKPSIHPTASDMRIITMSPHLTELVYLLQQDKHLIAVSDHSDYPELANQLPSVVSYQGADIPAILRLQPTHILAWKGGNKASDIAKLRASGVNVYASNVTSIDSLIITIKQIAEFLNQPALGMSTSSQLQNSINKIRQRFDQKSKTVLYFISLRPLIALGNDPWLNDLLKLCGFTNLLENTVTPYPQVSMAQVLRHSSDLIIAANQGSMQDVDTMWPTDTTNTNTRILLANPDKLHRFTHRAIYEMEQLCEQTYSIAPH
jgi:vitamin B12 transport system substrate-binding protein